MSQEVIPFDFYTISAVGRGRFLGGSFVHNSCQSMCYDSRNKKYIVGFAMPGNVSAMVRMKDLSFADSAVEATATELPLEHCNDMAYDPNEHKVYVVGGGAWVGVVNPDTLRVERKIPIEVGAWSIARYPDGSWFIHEGDRGVRYNHNFSAYTTISTGDWMAVINALNVPYRPARGDYAGVWQGGVILDGKPYKIFNEMDPKTGDVISFVLFSCEAGNVRTIYRAETGHEIESADYVNGKMMLAYNEPYRYGGCEWEMSEIMMKTVYVEIPSIDLVENNEITIDLSGSVPAGYELVSANINAKLNGSSIRTLPFINNNGVCLIRIYKVAKNKIVLKVGKTYTGSALQITGFCRKKA